MGGSNSTRRVSFETDENEKVTVVKGVRVSDSDLPLNTSHFIQH